MGKKRRQTLRRRFIVWLLVSAMVLSSDYSLGIASAKEKVSYEKNFNLPERESLSAKKEAELEKYIKETKLKRRGNSLTEKTMIANDYLEFMVDNNGRFTIGNIEGNPSYTSDNNQILLFGHSDPGTSFSTIRIQSSRGEVEDFEFSADRNVYDTENKMVTSEMKAEGSFDSGEAYDFTITQYLEFVIGNRGVDDTVKISYKMQNNGSLTQKAGMRIMMDTMLANHDDAPFKVVGHGNVTSELELRGDEVPASYQVYDVLDNPSTFATGMLYLGNDRIPDKVQFARWDAIYHTLYDYRVGNREFGDSAVSVYFNPINVETSRSTTVCTYYGVNSNLTSEEDTETTESIDNSQYGVLVYDSLSQEHISGAAVQIEGQSVVTNEHGLAVFNDYVENNGKNVTVSVTKNGYKTTEVPRSILCGSFTGIGIVSENSTSQEPSVLSAVMQSGTSIYDLLTTYVYYDEADDKSANESVLIRVANAGTANTYRLVQGGEVKYESTDGTFTIPIATKDKDGNIYTKPRIVGLSAGKDVTLEMVCDGWAVKSTKLGLRISSPTYSAADSEKMSISVGDKLEFTISDDVPILGGLKLDFGIANPLPIEIKADEDGKFRVALGGDVNDSSDAWEKYKKSYNEMREKVDEKNVSKLEEYIKKGQSLEGLTKELYGAGPLKFECKLMGYGEGVADSNGNLNIELGVIIELKEKKDFTHYFFLSALPIYVTIGETGEIATQIKGNLVYGDGNFSFVGGDCTIEPSFQLSLEGGVGVKGAVSVSAEGSGKVSWLHRFTNNYNRVWLSAAFAVKAKVLVFEASKTFNSPEWTIYDSNDHARASRQARFFENTFDSDSFKLSRRKSEDISMYTPVDNLSLESMYTDVQEVTVNGKRYRFYLADDSNRTEENRTTIVYQKYEDGEWTEAVQLNDDGTADFNFALAVSGEDIYIVWQNMNKTFDENVVLSDMIKSSQISLCKLDTVMGETTKLYDSIDDGKGDFLPTVAITSQQNIRVAWYSNSSNYIYGNFGETEEGHDSIYYVEVPNDSKEENAIEAEHITIDNGHVMSLSTGVLGNKDIITYALDEDGDFKTENDIALYTLKENDAQIKTEKLTTEDIISTNAKFAVLNGENAMFYYSSGNVAYSVAGSSEDTAYVFDKNELPAGLTDKFSVLTNSNGTECCILWKNANEEEGEDIFAAKYQNNKWSKPCVLTTVHGTDVSIPSGYIDDNGAIVFSYGYNNEDSEAVVQSEYVECNTDISLEGILFEHEDVHLGEDLPFQIQVSNGGLRDVSSVHIEISQDDSIIASQDIDIDLGVGVSVTDTISSLFTVPENLSGVTEFKVTVYADDESELEDNKQIMPIGYTDLSIEESGRYMAAGNEYIALKVGNQSEFTAQNVRVRVLADSMDGAVVYDRYFETMEAGTEKIYNINANQLAGSRVAYALVSCESEEFHSYNNTELLAINPYLKREEAVTYAFAIKTQDGGKIITGMDGDYEAGIEIAIKAEADEGYEFAGWTSEAGTFTDASNKATTFIMPEQDVVVTAKFSKKSSAGYPRPGDIIVIPTATPTVKPSTKPSSEPTPEATVTPDIPKPTATPEPTDTPEPSVEPSSTPDMDKDDQDDSSEKNLKKGSKVTDSKTKAVYMVTGTGKNKTVEYDKSTKKNIVNVTVPSTIKLQGKTYKVTSIKNGAFKNNKKLRNAKIGRNVTTIGESAFSGCNKLTYVVIGKNVGKIGAKAFYQCKNLRYILVKTKKLTLGKVGKNAFKGGYYSPRIKTEKGIWKRYANIFSRKGMSRRAVYIVSPTKLVR